MTGFFNTSPDYSMIDFQLKIIFRERFYRDWLTLKVYPFLSFPQDFDRNANSTIVVKLEAEFGYPSTP